MKLIRDASIFIYSEQSEHDHFLFTSIGFWQILNAEEELKKRSMQGMAVRPSLPLQVDTTNDTGSMTKLNTPRMASDGNPIGEVDGDGGDDASNQNTLSRNLLRMSSSSPSSDSQLRKTPYNVVTALSMHELLPLAFHLWR